MSRRNRLFAATSLVVLGLLTLGGCANPSQAAPLVAGMARVWVLRQPDPPQGNIEGARPVVFANGVPIGESTQGTAFFHDFSPGTYSPGTYKLTVQAFGKPAGQSDTVQLSSGMQSYVQVQAGPKLGAGLRGRWLQLCGVDHVA